MTASPIPLRPETTAESPALSTLQPPGWKKPKGYATVQPLALRGLI